MLYNIPLKKLKSLPNFSIQVIGKPLFILKNITPKKVASVDLEKSLNSTLEDLEYLDFYSKYVYANRSQQNIINLTKDDDNIVFTSLTDLAIYHGLSELKVDSLFISSDFSIPSKVAKELSYNDLPESFNTKGLISWEVPKFEVINEWDNKDFVIKALSDRFPNYVDIFTLTNKDILLDEDVISQYISRENTKDSIPWEIIDSDNYKRAVISNPNNFAFHYKSVLVDILARDLYPLFAKIDVDEKHSGKFTTTYFKSVLFTEYLAQNELSNKVKHALWFWENYLSKFDRCIEFGVWGLELYKNKSYTQFMEIFTLFDRDFFKNDDVQKIVRESYSKLNRDYGSEFLNKFIPSDYFEDKETCIEFIKNEILAGQNNASQIFNTNIQKHFKNDTEFFFKMLDFIKDKAPSNNVDALSKSIVSRFSDFAAYEEKKKIDYFKLHLLVGKVNLQSWNFNPYIVSTYEKYLDEDKSLMDFIISSVPASHAASLPNRFLFRIEDKNYIKELVRCDNNLMLAKGVPASWIYDVDLIILAGQRSHDIKFNKKEFKKIVTDKSIALKLVTANPFLLHFLPSEYKSDKDVALTAIKSRKTLAKECNQSLFLDVDFCLEMLKKNCELFSLVPNLHLQDSQFMTKLFQKLDNGDISFSVTRYFPPEITKCLSAFNVQKGGYEEFAISFFVKQVLSNKFNKNDVKESSIKKIKI